MKNIELKIRVNNFEAIEKSLKLAGAEYRGVLSQKDTYFNCARGRLKIREINNHQGELIFYQRPDTAINKVCDYSVVSLDCNQLQNLKIILTAVGGIKVVVSKKRRVWLLKNTRIHLDQVGKLGKFLELETVLRRISKAKGEKEYFEIYRLLRLSRFKKISQSYSDLISAAKRVTRAK